jgi:all-trans-retinol dehydrogenase (NAD+)
MFANLWMRFKTGFASNGGWSSKKNIAYIVLFLYTFYTFIKEQGWLPKKSVRGKHIFITGAGSGLGRTMATKFAKLGAKVTISDINIEGVEETKRIIKAETGVDLNVNVQKLDVSNRQNITDLAQQCKTLFGDVDILINNAGVV